MIWDGQRPYPCCTGGDSIVLIQPWGAQELLPWWYRTPWGYSDRGWFTEAYPVLSPYYPIWTANPEWIDTWSMQPYQGLW